MPFLPGLVNALAAARRTTTRGASTTRGTSRGGKSKPSLKSNSPLLSPNSSPSPSSPVTASLPQLVTPGPSSQGQEAPVPTDLPVISPAASPSLFPPAVSSPSPDPHTVSSTSPEPCSSSDSEPDMPTITPAAHVAVQSQGHRHPPIIFLHRITISELNMAVEYLHTYFNYKKITDVAERKLVLIQCFTHPDSIDFFMAHRSEHADLTWDALLSAVRSEVVSPRWDRDVYDPMSFLGMLTSEAGSFGALWNKMKLLNAALENTNYHRSEDELQRLVHSRLLPSFVYYASDKGTDDRTPFAKWKVDMATLSESFPSWYAENRKFWAVRDDAHIAQVQLLSIPAARITSSSQQTSSVSAALAPSSSSLPPPPPPPSSSSTAATNNNSRSQVNRRANKFSHAYPAAGASSHSTEAQPPALRDGQSGFGISAMTAQERGIYSEHKACFKCRTFYAGHRAADCPPGSETRLSQPWRPITAADGKIAGDVFQRTGRPVTLDAVLSHVNKLATASAAVNSAAAPVAGPPITDIGSLLDSPPAPVPPVTCSVSAPVAASYNLPGVIHVDQGASVYDSLTRGTSSLPLDPTPVAPVAPVPDSEMIPPISALPASDSDSDYEPSGLSSPSPPERVQRAVSAGPSSLPVASTSSSIAKSRGRSATDNAEEEHARSKPFAVVDDSESVSTAAVPAPFSVPHLLWTAALTGPKVDFPRSFSCLLDTGSHLTLIRSDVVRDLGLLPLKLDKPFVVGLFSSSSAPHILDCYVRLKLSDPSGKWTSRTVNAIVSHDLCSPLILGLPFFKHNHIVVDPSSSSVVHVPTGFDLLHPDSYVFPRASVPPVSPPSLRRQSKAVARLFADTRRKSEQEVKSHFQSVLAQLKAKLRVRRDQGRLKKEFVRPFDIVGAVKSRVLVLAYQKSLEERSSELKSSYLDVFGDIPHADTLPTDIVCEVKLKDASKTIQTRSYASPKKFKDAWGTLIQKHLDAGRIRPSSSPYASPAFLVPKKDPSALPRWVNDYRNLNSNTVPDRHPLPCIDDILADCAKGKIWGKMDMTDSFFQTRLHPDSIPLLAVNTPLGLYEWTVMPQGFRNSPAVQQRRVTAALRPFIGKFCHIYLDDIIIWSSSVEEHARHASLILQALRDNKLFCNAKKCAFFQLEVDFLGHRISERGIEADPVKVESICAFPRPKNAEETRRFLGMVRFLAGYLPNLADFTRVLTPLTRKECDRVFPDWTEVHDEAFIRVKDLLLSREVLTAINHEDPGDNKVFLVCDASNWRTGAVLMWGSSLDKARPVAFDSQQLKGPELRYPVHEKELLSIVKALKKWRAECFGMTVHVLTDHRTLENFETQKDLSARQLRWQEFLSQYELVIAYIKGVENSAADALSRIPAGELPSEKVARAVSDGVGFLPFQGWSHVCPILNVSADESFLADIRKGYDSDDFIRKISAPGTSVPGIVCRDGLWFVCDRLVVPKFGSLRENLYRLCHDCAGHWGADKCYNLLKDSYFWPGMRRDLYNAYVPSCKECQRNKSRTKGSKGPLHPLPVPDARFDSVAIDFVGPLPEESGFNCIVTMTDRLGADIRLVPCRLDISAEDFAVIFFKEWYCENGLPRDIVSDRDKLFVSRFWQSLHALIGVDLKMSTAYHPETDGSSERTNKTLGQQVRYFVERQQKGWVKALPIIRFHMLLSVNASTGVSGFELKTGRVPRMIPPLVPSAELPASLGSSDAAVEAARFLETIRDAEAEARDNLLVAKVSQSAAANKHRHDVDKFEEGDLVWLSTLHRHKEYMKKGEKRVAKFLPRFDGPYEVISAHRDTDTYTLELPNQPNVFPTFYVSELKRYVPNDDTLFPGRSRVVPAPIVVNGVEEYVDDRVVDSRRCGRGWRFLIRLAGYGPSFDRWVSYTSLKGCSALDEWLATGNDGPVLESVPTVPADQPPRASEDAPLVLGWIPSSAQDLQVSGSSAPQVLGWGPGPAVSD